MICPVLLEIAVEPSTALARLINAPVSSSCNLAVSAFFPQAPAFPVQPVHPTVCTLKTKHFLIHYCILLLFLFYSFPINTYRYNLPW